MAGQPTKIFYQCTRCGACCKWPGDVCIEESEIPAMAAHLGISVEQFIADYCCLRKNRQGLSIMENNEGACIMLENNACRINSVKPVQCREFPNGWNFPGWREQCKCEAVILPE